MVIYLNFPFVNENLRLFLEDLAGLLISNDNAKHKKTSCAHFEFFFFFFFFLGGGGVSLGSSA